MSLEVCLPTSTFTLYIKNHSCFVKVICSFSRWLFTTNNLYFVLYCIVLYCIVLYCIVLYRIVFIVSYCIASGHLKMSFFYIVVFLEQFSNRIYQPLNWCHNDITSKYVHTWYKKSYLELTRLQYVYMFIMDTKILNTS